MSDYPQITQVEPTRRFGFDGLEVERSESGKPRFRSSFSQTRYEFTVVHECLDVDKTTLLDHYAAHKMAVFAFTFQGDLQVYNVGYGATPEEQPIEGNFRWRIVNRLIVA